MPTSAVKLTYGPHERQKVEGKLLGCLVNPRQMFAKRTRLFSGARTLFAVSLVLSCAMIANVHADTINVRISVTSIAAAKLKIDLSLPTATNALSFRNTYAGVLGLGERIETVEGIRDNGEQVRVPKLAPGEFRSSEKFSRFAYEVNLAETLRSADLSHVSSLNSERGLLMLADLLPQSTDRSTSHTSAVINIDAPPGWTVVSNIKNEDSRFVTNDSESGVFLIGPSVNQKRRRVSAMDFSVLTSGQWPFSDNEATKTAGKILDEYSRVTGFVLKGPVMLMLVPYPGGAGPESWTAETRGNLVVLVLGRNARAKRVLSRLGIVLSHELLHLWVPNSLQLEGAYDWFFEGFTLYQALRMDLRLGLISFADYLETIAHVYDSYGSKVDHDRLSLIEASEQRWTTSSSLVYEKGMLLAFIYDLSLRKLTDCRSSLDDVYAELFRLPRTGQRSANETIISLLSEHEGLKTFARDYIESAGHIDLDSVVSPYGIQLRQGPETTLVVAREPTKGQRKFLACIGYRK